MNAAGTEDLNTTLASIFAINSVTGEVVYQSTPTPVTGTVTIYAIVRTESGGNCQQRNFNRIQVRYGLIV